jgi:hypothetical protein
MTLAAALLQKLSGISSPASFSAGKSGASPSAAHSSDFAAMLARVEQGQVSSGVSVTAARGLEQELSEGEIAALSKAADLAEAKGATQVAVRMQGKMYTVDVGVRQVMSVQPVGSAPVTGIDALIDLDACTMGNGQQGAQVSRINLGTQHGLNETLRQILASVQAAA